MFNMSCTMPCAIQGTIRVRKQINSMGRVTDIEGTEWDVRGIVTHNGERYVQAVPVQNLHRYYTDTSDVCFDFQGSRTIGGGGLVRQSWKPYSVEVVSDDTVGTNGSPRTKNKL